MSPRRSPQQSQLLRPKALARSAVCSPTTTAVRFEWLRQYSWIRLRALGVRLPEKQPYFRTKFISPSKHTLRKSYGFREPGAGCPIMISYAAAPDGPSQRLRTQGEESPNSAEQCAGSRPGSRVQARLTESATENIPPRPSRA